MTSMLSNTKKQRQRHKHKGTKNDDLKSANGFYVEQDKRGGSIVGTLIGFHLISSTFYNLIEGQNCLVSIKKLIKNLHENYLGHCFVCVKNPVEGRHWFVHQGGDHVDQSKKVEK